MIEQRRLILWFILTLTATSISNCSFAALGLSQPEQAAHSPAAHREKRIQTLKALSQNYEATLAKIRSLHEAISKKMRQLKKQTVDRLAANFQQFLSKKLSLLGQQHTTLIEWEEVIQKTIRLTEETAARLQEQELLQKQTTEPQKTLEIMPSEKSITSHEDVVAAEQHMVEAEALRIETQKNSLLIAEDLAQRKRAFGFAEEEYDQKKSEQEQFASGNFTQEKENNGFSSTQQAELIDLEERLDWYKRELAAAKVQEKEQALESNEILLSKLKAQAADFKKIFSRVKKNVYIPAEYVSSMEQGLNQKRQAAISERETNNEHLRKNTHTGLEIAKKIQAVQAQFNISSTQLSDIRSLSKEPQNNTEWLAYARLLDLFIDESLNHIEREYLIAQSQLDKAQFQRDELEVSIIRSWQRMTSKEFQFKSDEEVEQELKNYKVIKAEFEERIEGLIRSRDAAINSLHEFNVSFEKLHALAGSLTRSQFTTFKDRPHEYYEIIKVFEGIEEKIRHRFDGVSLLIEKYSTAIKILQGTIKKTEGIIQELDLKGFWRRSESSLSWSDFTTFWPDISRFWNDLKKSAQEFFASLYQFSPLNLLKKIAGDPLQFLLIIVNLLLIITCYRAARVYLPDIALYISRVAPGYWIIHSSCVAFAAFLSFINLHLRSVYWWLLLLVLIRIGIIRTVFLAQLFYILTIPYALWLAYQMICYWKEVNRERKYLLVSEKFEARFFTVIGLMLGVLVIVLCTREAFLLGNYQDSRVPVVLGAILFLSGQASVIALLGRTQILGIIGSETPLREWAYDHVNRYFYLVWCVVIATIVMFNPYIGYGKQVFYVIVRLLLTGTLISIASWIYGTVKHASVDLFFYYADRDALKERFVTARFWYTLFIILSLLIFLATVIYMGAYLWGQGLTFRDMYSWLEYAFYTPYDESGKQVSVTFLSLGHIALYILGGFVCAYCINTFILSRVLDPIIVESGVQNTVLTLTRYIIITIALFMGLTNAGLEALTTKLAIVLAGISFIIQEPLRDFFSYFILLVQRPVKVGDFIRVLDSLSENENVSLMGFVRSINPRSIVVRKRNSTTVIIPNSRVVMNPVMNWSYTRGFFAFDDIRISVPYGSDPSFARQLMLDAIDKNPNILKNPSPIVRLDDFVDNGYSFLVRGFLTSNKIGEQWDIASDVRLGIVKSLRDNRIEVASPVRTIRISKGGSSLLPEDPDVPQQSFDGSFGNKEL